MNKIILLGRLTRDPDVRYTQNGKVVCQFTLAVDRPFAGQDGKKEADFIPIVIWGKSAETLGNTVTKGQRALVEGRLQIRSYEAKDGSTRWQTEVIADRFEYIERKGQNGTTTQAPQNKPATAPTAAQAGNGEATPMEGFGQEIPFDEEIPF